MISVCGRSAAVLGVVVPLIIFKREDDSCLFIFESVTGNGELFLATLCKVLYIQVINLRAH